MTNEIITSRNFNTPVLFVFFNRKDLAHKVFEQICKVKPSRIYLSSDGPRPNVASEKEIVNDLRDSLLNRIDWKCEVFTNFGETNLGCGLGVASAINWFFENEEKGIILEDDSFPSLSFFYFCQDLLNKYHNDKRIWHISGTSFVPKRIVNDESYYFSKMSLVPGWATWRDRWRCFDINMDLLDDFRRKEYLKEIVHGLKLTLWHNSTFVNNVLKINNGWGWQWYFCIVVNHGLCVNPVENLVQNIGINRADAVHTNKKDEQWEDLVANDIAFPLIHPKMFCIDGKLDEYVYARFTSYYTPIKLIRSLLILSIRYLDKRITKGRINTWFIKRKYNL